MAFQRDEQPHLKVADFGIYVGGPAGVLNLFL